MTAFPTFVLWRERAVDWWRARQSRERRLIRVMAAVIVVALGWTLMLRPALAARAEARADARLYAALAAQLEATPVGAAPSLAGPVTGPAATVAAETAAASGLTIRQIEPESAGARVVLAGVDFAALIGWIDGLEREAGLIAGPVEIRRAATPGLVDAEVVVGPGA